MQMVLICGAVLLAATCDWAGLAIIWGGDCLEPEPDFLIPTAFLCSGLRALSLTEGPGAIVATLQNLPLVSTGVTEKRPLGSHTTVRPVN